MTINADSIEEYLNTEDIVYISSLPTPEEKESAIFSRITTLPTVQVRINPGQTETPIKNSIPTYRNLSTDEGKLIYSALSPMEEQVGVHNICIPIEWDEKELFVEIDLNNIIEK